MESISGKSREKGIYKVTIVGSFVNLLLLLIKFVAGVLGRSAAMIADAVHSLSDFITDVIVIVFVKISNKPQDESHSYGHGKFETLATMIIGVILMTIGLSIAYSGTKNIIAVARGATLPSPGKIALWAALVSILFKELLYWYTRIEGKKLKSDAVVANAWHHRSDAFSSIGTALGIGGAIVLGDKWTILDPIAAVIVSVFIVITAAKLLKPAIDELMEASLPEEVENEIIATVEKFDNVGDMHNLRTRKIGNCYAIEFHVRMASDTPLEDAHHKITDIETSLKECFGKDTHVIIHMEPEKHCINDL